MSKATAQAPKTRQRSDAKGDDLLLRQPRSGVPDDNGVVYLRGTIPSPAKARIAAADP
jgi:hypothetical protein